MLPTASALPTACQQRALVTIEATFSGRSERPARPPFRAPSVRRTFQGAWRAAGPARAPEARAHLPPARLPAACFFLHRGACSLVARSRYPACADVPYLGCSCTGSYSASSPPPSSSSGSTSLCAGLLPAASAGIISLHARAAPVHCEFFEYVFKNGRHRLKHTVPLYIYCTRAR